MKSIKTALDEIKYKNRPKNLSQEFQVYGCYLAESLDDTKHYSLYIKLAKECNRGILEEALNYTKGYYSAKNKGRVFMWRLKQLKQLDKEITGTKCDDIIESAENQLVN
jgi:hypothetical protein